VKGNPNNDDKDGCETQPDTKTYERRLLPSLDGGDDRRAAMRTRPRMVADLPAAFVAFDEGHK
jgi:hypothetical protein